MPETNETLILPGETGDLELPDNETAPLTRPRRSLGGLLLLAFPIAILGVAGWLYFGSSAEARRKPAADETAKAGDGQTAQPAASEELNEALKIVGSGQPQPVPPPASGVGVATEPPPVTVVPPPPDNQPQAAPVQSPAPEPQRQNMQNSQASSYRSVVFEDSAPKPISQENAARPVAFTPKSQPDAAKSLPRFGALLPVRLLGTVFTLRDNAAIRLGLMRDVQTSNGTIAAGTELIGRVTGSADKRVFIQIEGYLREDGTVIAFGGEALGADGADGFAGRKRDVSSRWKRVFSTIGRAVFSLGRAYLQSRGNGAVIIGDAADSAAPEFQLRQEIQSFVELTAGTVGFVRVTSLGTPSEIPAPVNEPPVPSAPGPVFTEAMLADLFERGTEADLRAALPKLPVAMRPLVESFLTQASTKGGAR